MCAAFDSIFLVGSDTGKKERMGRRTRVGCLTNTESETTTLLFSGNKLVQVDTVVWCTGYNYSFPFLDGSGLLTDPVSQRVHPLYEQLFHVQHPSLSFVGLPQR